MGSELDSAGSAPHRPAVLLHPFHFVSFSLEAFYNLSLQSLAGAPVLWLVGASHSPTGREGGDPIRVLAQQARDVGGPQVESLDAHGGHELPVLSGDPIPAAAGSDL